MEAFQRLCATAVPIAQPNIDTGNLAHSQWCRDHPNNLAPGLLRDWRFDATGKEIADFILNTPRYRDARIMIGGSNFGCGSSRETAVWALMQYGFRAVIAPSFGDIFRDNCYQNGLLPVVLPEATVEKIGAILEASNLPQMCVDLETQVIEIAGLPPISFEIAGDRRLAMLEGLDETLLIRRSEDDIAAFQASDRLQRPWIYQRSPR